MHDTTPDGEQMRLDAIRRMDPVERMRQAFEFSEWVRKLALSRLRAAYPDRSEQQLVDLLIAQTHGGGNTSSPP